MDSFFRRVFTPWRAEGCFSSREEFLTFLRRYDRIVGAVRTVLLLTAAISLLAGYAFDLRRWDYVAVGALAVVMIISLPVLQNEKLLPKEDEKP